MIVWRKRSRPDLVSHGQYLRSYGSEATNCLMRSDNVSRNRKVGMAWHPEMHQQVCTWGCKVLGACRGANTRRARSMILSFPRKRKALSDQALTALLRLIADQVWASVLEC